GPPAPPSTATTLRYPIGESSCVPLRARVPPGRPVGRGGYRLDGGLPPSGRPPVRERKRQHPRHGVLSPEMAAPRQRASPGRGTRTSPMGCSPVTDVLLSSGAFRGIDCQGLHKSSLHHTSPLVRGHGLMKEPCEAVQPITSPTARFNEVFLTT